jgi:hypothetical protein
MAYFNKDYDGNFSYSYYGVCDTILGDYVTPGAIDAYLEDEVFWEAVRRSYTSIDLSGKSKRDMERFNAKRLKTAEWLRKKANAFYF